MPVIQVVEALDLDALPPASVTRFRVDMVRDGMGEMVRLPVMVVKGARPGPRVGFTAAVHGNELNGVRVIQRVIPSIEPETLAGTVVAVPVVNVPGYLAGRREFNDNADLNRVMPGVPRGAMSHVYAHRFIERVIRHLDYLIDLHTASAGRVNSLYVRADLRNAVTSRMAYLERPEIIVHNASADGTLRSAAAAMGVHAITVEIGDPSRFQRDRIQSSVRGSFNVLQHLEMVPERAPLHSADPVICGRSYWIYTDRGGLLDVYPEVGERVTAGQRIARVSDMFGDTVCEYEAPEAGIVVGKSVNPVNQAGSRILHLGIEGLPPDFPDPGATLASWPKVVSDD
ncbi:succinylglutamate desuccinylase/aspartoacylase family protein [Paraliomyxa miuraensis]|uniref:succinylglutamate desuccinylase/aspartoacylase family protein n=1 Tax=Paraliomyxa miuraensis TaxID=376150 RepID=UPI00225513D1|nr:succinylglutamate desuccinylase/aspartoacylase family protein [Paraliomyxa miuraensis]MCX4240791.1 succinylglutamate desuccinylase/aspartoacylase family protein [Paraliomyxa miuraensis]